MIYGIIDHFCRFLISKASGAILFWKLGPSAPARSQFNTVAIKHQEGRIVDFLVVISARKVMSSYSNKSLRRNDNELCIESPSVKTCSVDEKNKGLNKLQ